MSQGTESPQHTSDRILDVLADLPVFRGQAEHAALMKAMEHETPACDGLDVFTADRLDDP